MPKKIQRHIIFSIGIFLAFFPELVFAQATTGVDAIQMLINLSNSYPALWRLVTGVCYLVGFILAMRGVYHLKLYGELRTMMSTQTSLKVPVALFIVSAVLIFIPTGFKIVSNTIFGYSSPLAYTSVTAGMNPIVLNAITGLISFIGLLAFVRGWLILVAHAEHPGGQATLGKALTHIIGGLCAINILGIVDIIWNTFGFKTSGV